MPASEIFAAISTVMSATCVLALVLFLSALALGAALIVSSIASIPFWIPRLMIQYGLPKLWKLRYFRTAINYATVLSGALLVVAIYGCYFPRTLDNLVNSSLQRILNSRDAVIFRMNSQLVYNGEKNATLQRLLGIKFFLDYYAIVVVVPSFIVGWIEYAPEKREDEKKVTSATTLAT